MGGRSEHFASNFGRHDHRHVQHQRRRCDKESGYEFAAAATSNSTQTMVTQASFIEKKVPSCASRSQTSSNPRRRQGADWLQRGSLFQVLVVLLVGPHLLAALSHASGLSSPSTNVGGAWAATELETRNARNAKAAAVAAAESFQYGQRQQQPFMANANVGWTSPAASAASQSGADLSPLSVSGTTTNVSSGGGDINGALAANRTYIGHAVSVEALVEQRWGHTAAFLPDAGVILFTGGQIASSDGRLTVTNDVFALNINGSTSSSTSTKASKRDTSASSSNVTVATTAQQQQWIRLSSSNLPPHAFGARAVTHTSYHTGERLFLVGGATADCSIGNAPVYVWSAEQSTAAGWKQGTWRAPIVADGQTLPPRRRGAMAVQVPVAAGLNATEAAQAKARGGVSFMVLGGYADYTTCNGSTPINVQQPLAYSGVDVWTIAKATTTTTTTTTTQQKKRRDVVGDNDDDNGERLTVRSLPLDERMANMSVIDYATVVLPANETANVTTRVLLIGGRDMYGSFTPMNQLWLLDLQSSQWHRIDTTNGSSSGLDIPLGRMGHSATMLSPTKVLVHGGYVTLDDSQMASNDSYLLDLTVAPWVWNKVTTAIDGPNSVAPRRAYHTSVIANGIFVLGFGQESKGSVTSATSGGDAITKRQSDAPSTVPVHYLDTLATDRWAWTTDLKSLLAARVASTQAQPVDSATAAAQSTSAAATSQIDSASAPPLLSPSSDAVSSSPSAGATSSAADTTKAPTSSKKVSQSVATSASPTASSMAKSSSPSTATPSNDPDAPPLLSNTQTSDDNSDNGGGGGGTSAKQRNTAVIASVLGAAAVVASLGGLYAAKRRRSRESDNDSIGDDKYERFDSNASPGQAAPPVSSLWINQPMSWANGLRRHASMASGALARTMSFRTGGAPQGASAAAAAAAAAAFASGRNRGSIDDDTDSRRYSTPTQNDNNPRAVQVLRNLPATSRFSMRRSKMQQQRDVRSRLDADEDDYDYDEGKDRMFDVTLDDDDAADEGHGRRDVMTPLPDDFIQTLLDDDDARAQRDIRRTVGGDSAVAAGRTTLRRGPSLLRTRSTESLSSAGSASHFSYPYLAAMHRPSIGDLSLRTSTVQGNLSPGSSQGAPAISPREALLRASLSRSPGSQPLYRAMAAASAASPAWSSPALSAVLRAGSNGGKNARLVQRLQGGMATTPALPDLHFGNPFDDQLPAIPASSSSQVSSPRAPTELDLATTVLGGEEGGHRGMATSYDSPSAQSPLFPWQATPRQASPAFPSSSRVPLYQQPSTGVRLPIHPALLSAAAEQQQQQGGARHTTSRRARPSLLRVTNQGDDARD